jgi:hypothetical protein
MEHGLRAFALILGLTLVALVMRDVFDQVRAPDKQEIAALKAQLAKAQTHRNITVTGIVEMPEGEYFQEEFKEPRSVLLITDPDVKHPDHPDQVLVTAYVKIGYDLDGRLTLFHLVPKQVHWRKKEP